MVKAGTYAGIAWEDGLVEAAVARADERGGIAVERRPARPAAADPAAAAGVRWSPPLAGAVSVGLPAAQALIRLAVVPSRDPAEWRSMALLDAENFAPLPMDQLYAAVEEAGALETATRAWVVLVRRSAVDGLGDAFRRAGAPPERVDLNLLGWWELWRGEAGAAGDGRRIALRIAGAEADLVVVDDGQPVFAAGLPAATPAGLAAGVAERLAAVEWEHGTRPIGGTAVWRRAAGGSAEFEEALRAALRETAGIAAVEFRALADGAVAEGLARRAARGALNLAPDAWRTERDRRARRRTVRRAAAAVALAWAAGLAAFYGALRIQRARAAADQAAAEAMRGPAEAAVELRDRLRSFEGYAARTHSALEALREVTERLPAGVELNSFTYRKHATVALRGTAERPEAIYDFLQALEQSAFFTRVESGEVRSRGAGGARRSEFNVTAHLPGREDSP